MSVEVTIVCDNCAAIIVAARTAGEARKEGLRDKALVRRNGQDICAECNERARRRKVDHARDRS